ncbi:Tad domain-containing protein [Vibrio sp.]|nr:Tad domain-containing protein [Vibrio sp.]
MSLLSRKHSMSYHSIAKQKGLTAIFVTVAFLFLVGIAALAVDVNHAYMNKSKLQNSVDAAALSAAFSVDNNGSISDAELAALNTLTQIEGFEGNSELSTIRNYVSITFSDDPTNSASFVSGGSFSSTAEAIYVRVAVAQYPLSNFFVQVFNLEKFVSASAVAGPSATINPQNIVPITICQGDNPSTPIGYEIGEVYAVKSTDNELGSGNFQFLDFDDSSGASDLSENLAGAYEGNISLGDIVVTEPGQKTQKVINGINSRLGTASKNSVDTSVYPSDKYVKEPDTPASLNTDGSVNYTDSWGADEYSTELTACVNGATNADCSSYYKSSGAYNRRMLVVPIVDCSGGVSGKTSLVVTEFACFFLLQSIEKSGSSFEIFGEFVESCPVIAGGYDPDNGGDGQYRIVLFNDPLSEGS